ncbi:MAG TPA: hypothetical protein VFC19_53815 [Candidatus Limnocylindrales bacterium]|nr:hypothetical protein [Candidatus Limnocylindrales bacterium]
MAGESRKEPEQEPVEALIDDLIRDILGEAGQSPKTAARGPLAALIETVMAAPSQAAPSRASMFERLLFTQTIASALADALAPALAEALTPEILKALEHYAAGEKSGEPAAVGEGARRAGSTATVTE